jgi:hypothetical protein
MIQIRIQNYLRQVQVSKARRKKYFENSHPDKYPKMYQNNRRYGFKDGRLYDFVSMEPVVANSRAAGKPRFAPVNGNVIMRMHKDVLWGKVIPALDEMFAAALKKQMSTWSLIDTPFPWKISLEFRTHYGYADWDIDNPWIYEKCFHDALKRHMGIEDSILKITNGGEKKFRPVRSFDTPELIVQIETDYEFDMTYNLSENDKVIIVDEGSQGKPGEIEYDYVKARATIYTGKKKPIYGSAQKAIRKLMFKCLNDLVPVQIPEDVYTRYKKFFDEFKNYNIQTIIK